MRGAACLAIMIAAVSLAGCQRTPVGDDVAKLDNQIAGTADPALTDALEDPIMTDPALAQQSNRNRVAAAGGPVQAQYPGSAAQRRRQAAAARAERGAMRNAAAGEMSACGTPFEPGMGWARRLPESFPVLPGARITEAAGADNGDCRMRVVAFTSSQAPERVIDWYRRRAAGAGFSSEYQSEGTQAILAGTRNDDAYYLIVKPLGRGGSDAALVANDGV